MRIFFPAWMVYVIACFLYQNAQATTTSFHIGNSLTQDSQPLALKAFAEQRGLSHDSGFHIRSGSAIYEILADPNDYSSIEENFGNYQEALTNQKWDYVTIQPHPQFDNPDTPENEDSNLATDEAGILEIINLARSNPAYEDTTFYIYQAWPNVLDLFDGNWNKGVKNNDDTRTIYRRAYFDHLINRVREETDAEVYMIPVGEVMQELDLRLKGGVHPDYNSILPFYEDFIHLERDIGRYVASMTTFVTLFQQDPQGMQKPEDFFRQESAFPNLYFPIIHDTIWDVVTENPYSNVIIPDADLNNDEAVNGRDLKLLQENFGTSDLGDSDKDGDSDGADFLNILRNYRDFVSSDLNRDLTVGAEDLSIWASSFGNGESGDSNGDGKSDSLDFLDWARQFGNSDIVPLSADFDKDYTVGAEDLSIWASSFGNGKSGDSNGDGKSDAHDFLDWVRQFGNRDAIPMSTDFNQDYAIGAEDLSIWASSFGNGESGDSNGDGKSDSLDFLSWAREFGNHTDNVATSTASVPEPTSLVLVLIALVRICSKRNHA